VNVSAGDIAGFAGLVIAIIALGGVIYSNATRFQKLESQIPDDLISRLARLEVKADAAWAAQIRRGAAEAVTSGIADFNSPLAFHANVLESLAPMKERLQMFAIEHADKAEYEFIMLLDMAFGDELLTRFCVPYKVWQGACLLAAMQVATGKPVAIEPYRQLSAMKSGPYDSPSL